MVSCGKYNAYFKWQDIEELMAADKKQWKRR
jgi:hypothetical protein